jgi:hypothetical protein
MILSTAHWFIFIKGLKVGGTSVEIALSTICGPDDIITPITPIDELKRLEFNGGARNYSKDREAELKYLDVLRQTCLAKLPQLAIPPAIYYNHMPLRDIVHVYGSDILRFRLLCVERHPYAKIISWANHVLSFEAYQSGGEMRCDRQELKRYLAAAIENRSILAVKNIDRYRLPDCSISANVMRFEQLDAEVRKFMECLGLTYRSRLPHAKRGILANDLDPRELLDKKQIALINEDFIDEFETFHYEPL